MNHHSVDGQEINKSLSQARKHSHIKECFHQDKTCSSQIILAHSIQKSKILKKIAHEGKVMLVTAQGDSEKVIDFLLEEKGIKKATTFTGFCKKHDNNIFRPIELKNFHKGDKEQEFLFAYRALAREYHTKKSVIKMLTNRSQEIYLQTGSYPKELCDFLFGASDAMNQLSIEKDRFNQALNHKGFNILKSRVYTFYHEHLISVCSCFNLRGLIRPLKEYEHDGKYLYLTVFPQEGKTYVIFSFLKNHTKYFSPILNQIHKLSINERKVFLSNLISIYVENFVISPRVWSSLPEVEKQVFNTLFRQTLYIADDELMKTKRINLFM